MVLLKRPDFHYRASDLARSRDVDKPFSEALMRRVVSYVVTNYWRREKRKPTILSLNNDIYDGDGNTIELIDTVADDKAIDLGAWLDARTWHQRADY